MAKMWWLIVAACLCQCYAVTNATNATKEAKEPKKEEEASGTGIILLGGIVFVFAIYYMANSHMNEVRTQTWSAISAAVSIFIAVMTNTMINNIVRDKEEGSKEEAVSTSKVCSLALQLAITTFVVCLTIFLQRASKLRVNAYGVIGGHILGFAAIATFGGLAGHETFGRPHSPWMTLVVALIYVVAVQILVFPVKMTVKIFGKCCAGNNSNKEELDRCEDQALDTSTDFFCMGLSFLLAMWIRGMILGEVAGMEAEGKGRKPNQVTFLALAGIAFALLSAVWRFLQHKEADKKGSAHAILDILGTTSSLGCAWCLLEAAQWNTLDKFKDEILGSVAVALGASVLFIVLVYVIAMVIKHVGSEAKRTLRGEFTAVGLLLGLAWENVFDKAVESLEPKFPEEKNWLYLALFTLALVLFVFPAWAVYILPKGNGEADGGLTPLTAFCDCAEKKKKTKKKAAPAAAAPAEAAAPDTETAPLLELPPLVPAMGLRSFAAPVQSFAAPMVMPTTTSYATTAQYAAAPTYTTASAQYAAATAQYAAAPAF